MVACSQLLQGLLIDEEVSLCKFKHWHAVEAGTVEGHQDQTLVYALGLWLYPLMPRLDLDLLSNSEFYLISPVEAKMRGVRVKVLLST